MPNKTTKGPEKPAMIEGITATPNDEVGSSPVSGKQRNSKSGLLKEIALKAAAGTLKSKQSIDQLPSDTTPPKGAAYAALVAERKICSKCCASGLTNPATAALKHLDSEHIGPWTTWNGDLDARLMVVGQEWGDVKSFVRQCGIDAEKSATNKILRELIAFAGLTVAPAPTARPKSGVFLTNAALCLKEGGAQAEVRREWFENCGVAFLRKQVELVRPVVVVSIGEEAYLALCYAFALPPESFSKAVNRRKAIRLPTTDALLVPVYHPGQRILNTHRKLYQQFEDWNVVRQLLAAIHVPQ